MSQRSNCNIDIFLFIFLFIFHLNLNFIQWKGISHKQCVRWQHISQLKARAFFSWQRNLVFKKRNNLYLGLVTQSSGYNTIKGWQLVLALLILLMCLMKSWMKNQGPMEQHILDTNAEKQLS